MRVLYFSRDYTVHDRRFLSKLAESEHEMWFLRLEDGGWGYEKQPLPERIRPVSWTGGAGVVDTPELWWRLMPEFTAILERLKPDLVHAGPVQSCGLMAAVAGARPLMIMSWGSDILLDAERDDLWRWMTRYALQRSDILVCDCRAVRERVQRLVPYPDDRIVQFPWGIDLSRFNRDGRAPDVRSAPGWRDAFIVLSTRSWEPVYGIDVLVNAFAAAYAENRRLRLILLGNGSLAPEIDGLIAARGLDGVVLRPGRASQADVSGYFRAADLYVSCAHSDGSSISLLEAMASGLPVVVTDVPGNREWVVGGGNGWLAPDGDSGGFAGCILACAGMDAGGIERIALRNRRVAEERADWDRNFVKLLDAYDLIRNIG